VYGSISFLQERIGRVDINGTGDRARPPNVPGLPCRGDELIKQFADATYFDNYLD
jgi:hypothetical protein